MPGHCRLAHLTKALIERILLHVAFYPYVVLGSADDESTYLFRGSASIFFEQRVQLWRQPNCFARNIDGCPIQSRIINLVIDDRCNISFTGKVTGNFGEIATIEINIDPKQSAILEIPSKRARLTIRQRLNEHGRRRRRRNQSQQRMTCSDHIWYSLVDMPPCPASLSKSFREGIRFNFIWHSESVDFTTDWHTCNISHSTSCPESL